MKQNVLAALCAQPIREKKRIILRFLRSVELGLAYCRFRYCIFYRKFALLASEIDSMWSLAHRFKDKSFMTSIWLYEERLGRYVESIKHEYLSFTIDRGDSANLDNICSESLIWLRIKEFDNEGIGNGVLSLGLVKKLGEMVRHVTVEVDGRMVGIWRKSLLAHPNITVLGFHNCARPEGYKVLNQTELKFLFLGAEWQIAHFVEEGRFSVDPDLHQKFRSAIRETNPGLPVLGLVWRSKNPGKRFPDFGQWLQLVSEVQATYVLLQYELAPEELRAFRESARISESVIYWGVRDLSGELDEHFCEIAALDGLITIPSSAGYFATALGVRSLTILDPEYSRQFPVWHSYTPWHPKSRMVHAGKDGFVDSMREVKTLILDGFFNWGSYD